MASTDDPFDPQSGLQRDSTLLRFLLDQPGLLVVVVDPDDRIRLFNRECERLSGFRAEEVLGKSLRSTLFPTADVPAARGLAPGTCTGDIDEEHTSRWVTRSGDVRRIRWTRKVLSDHDGEAGHVLAAGIDVTNLDPAPHARYVSDVRLVQLVDGLPVLVAHLDTGLRVLFANHGYRDWFGLDPLEQVGKHVRDVIGPEAFSVLRPRFEQALSGNKAVHHGKVPYAHGGTRFIHGTYSPSYNEHGRIDGVYILAVDLSEQQALRKRLDEETRRSRAIVENAIDGIITIDEQGIVRFFNRSAERIFGYRASEMIGRNVSTLMPEPDRSRHDEYIRHYLETGEASILGIGREVTGLHRDGSRIDLHLAVTEARDNGKRHFVGFLRDISDLKRAEREARERLAELAHVDRVAAMGGLATGLAHEISQPLTAIRATAEACLGMLGSPQPDLNNLTRALEQISRQGQRAGDVIEQLREFMRKGQSDSLALHDPNAMIRNVLALLRHELETAGIAVEFDLESPLCQCMVNRIQIEQVVFNLVRNAIDAMADIEGERILRFESRRVHDSDAACEISVIDSGPGVADTHKDRLFHPFFSTKTRGMGQGLTICRSILDAHGGRLTADNHPERGAAFRFTLPLPGGQGEDG